MASIELYNGASVAPQFGQGFTARVTALVARVARWNESRKTRAELYKLSIRELDDIGLAWGDIKNIR